MRISRREFLGAATAGAALGRAGLLALRNLPLAFSTLGCPDWEWEKILGFASANGVAAIELRGLLRNLDLPSCPEFSAGGLARTKREIADHGLKIACVSSSSAMHEPEPAKREASLADARRFIDLAAALGSPYVRVYGNRLEPPREQTLARVASGLRTLADYAGPRGVTVLIESHGDFTDSPTLKELLTLADSPHAALLWDAHHTFASSHEEPERTVAELGRWIRHTHLKDSVRLGTDRNYVLTGTGELPVERQVRALQKLNYPGYFCFEWEKYWHPELAEPEISIPDFLRVVGGYLQERSRS